MLAGLVAAGVEGCDEPPDRVAACLTPDGMVALAALVEELLAWWRLAEIQCAAVGAEVNL